MPPGNKYVEAYKREFARNGGNARAKALTAERRTEIARKAAQKRWKKRAMRSGQVCLPVGIDKLEESA